MCFTKVALTALQYVSEAYLVLLFEEATRLLKHNSKKTLKVRDLAFLLDPKAKNCRLY